MLEIAAHEPPVNGPSHREAEPEHGGRRARSLWLAGLAGLALAVLPQAAPAKACGKEGVAVQVLGSGGPIADDNRAGSGFLVWQNGRARVLVDAGGGTFVRFGEAGAQLTDLELIALTHLHTDHAAGLPAILKGGYFSDRERPLSISGPGGSEPFPGLKGFLAGLFHPERGAFRYLSGFRDGSGGLFRLEPVQVDPKRSSPRTVRDTDEITVRAVGVHHGIVPALGYLIEIGGHRLAFSGDQNAERPGFADMASGTDLLFMAHAIPEGAGEVARALHATPSDIGALAKQTNADKLVLTHLMARSLREPERSLARIRQRYDGPIVRAGDLDCFRPGD